MNPLLRKAGVLVGFAVAGTYAYVSLQGPRGIPALMEKRQQIVALQEENATLTAENRRLAESVEKLNKDRAAQRLKIRERLKLLQPNETQFVLPEQKSEPKSE
jgi:cell division protein FtsB